MNEFQRMQYLDAMGIEQFVPRKLLANSAALRLCELPVVQQVVETEITEVFEEERILPQAAEVVNRLLDVEAKTIKLKPEIVEKVLPEAKEEQAAKPVKQDVRFSLAVWQLQNGILVLDSHEPRAALPTEKLLANILMAAGLLELNLVRPGRLDWPLGSAAQAENAWLAAREYVESFIDAAHQKSAIQRILVFGESALKALIDEKEAEQIQFGQSFSLPSQSFSAMYFPALADLLRHPEYKLPVWRGLCRKGSGVL